MAIALFLFFVLLVLTINLFASLRAIRISTADTTAVPAPFVSVLIPARNEARNIVPCVRSLLAQDYSPFEVIVLDDESEDQTHSLVAQLSQDDSRVKVIEGRTLPEGWAGKPFACFQLATAARGDYLLFTDADTVHSPKMLSTVLPLAIASGASVVSGFPRQVLRSFVEKVTIPIPYYLILCGLPIGVRLPYNDPPRSFMVGQFMLFPREDYWRIGGHAAVKGRILEDLWMGVAVRRAGGKHLTLNLSSIIACRMYRDRQALTEGFLKWGYSFANLWPAGTLAFILIALALYFVPLPALIYGIIVPGVPTWLVPLATIQLGLIALGRFACDRALGEPLSSTLLTIPGLAFFLLAMLGGCVIRLRGGNVNWKRRSYGGTTGVG